MLNPGMQLGRTSRSSCSRMSQPGRSSMNGAFTLYAAVLMAPAGQVAQERQRTLPPAAVEPGGQALLCWLTDAKAQANRTHGHKPAITSLSGALPVLTRRRR
jgi:hypothetical protein